MLHRPLIVAGWSVANPSNGVCPPRHERCGKARASVPFVVLALAVAGLGFYFGSELSQSALGIAVPTTAPLRVEAKHLDFGETLARSDLEMRIPIVNVSGADVEIFDWDRSCGACTTIEPPSLTIPAGQTRDVLVRLDLALSRPAANLNTAREFERSMGPRIRFVPSGKEYRGPPMEWSLTGRVRDFVSADPTVVVCKEESIRGPAFSPFSINLVYGLDVESVTAACPPEQASVTAVQLDSRKWRLVVAPVAESQPKVGEFRFAVEVQHSTSDGTSLPPVVIPVTGSRVSDVVAEVLPSSVLGTHPVGTTLPIEIRLRSRTGSEFIVEPTNLDSTSLRIESSVDAQTGVTRYHFSKDVARKGLEKTELKFHVKHADGFEEESLARVFCIGVER